MFLGRLIERFRTTDIMLPKLKNQVYPKMLRMSIDVV